VASVVRIPNKEATPAPAFDSECRDFGEEGSLAPPDNSELEEIEYNDNDVIEGDSGFVYRGNIRFLDVVAGFRAEFLSTMHPEERNKIAERVVAEIQKRGGSFRSLNSQGTCRLLLFGEAVQRSRAALEKGNDNDVIEGMAGACDVAGNRRFRVIVAELRDEFLLSTTNPQERTEIAERVVNKIQNRGGLFLSLYKHGGCMRLSKREAIQQSKVALENGFSYLLQPQPASGRQGVGSKVLEYEVAPRYDVLTGKVRPSELVRFPTSIGAAQSQTRVGVPTNNGAAKSQDQDRLPTTIDAVQSHARDSLPNSKTAARDQARVSLTSSNGAAQYRARVGLPSAIIMSQSQARLDLPPGNIVSQSQARAGLPTSSNGGAQSLSRKRTCLEALCKEIVNL
jgi:hypothetical protein